MQHLLSLVTMVTHAFDMTDFLNTSDQFFYLFLYIPIVCFLQALGFRNGTLLCSISVSYQGIICLICGACLTQMFVFPSLNERSIWFANLLCRTNNH